MYNCPHRSMLDVENGDSYSSWAQIVHNILLFVPLGFILYSLQSHGLKVVDVMVVCVLLSVAIEGTQYITGLGWMEIDDVIWNGLGGIIGAGAAWLLRKIKNKSVSPDGA